MKNELDRVKGDLKTMEKALGLAPALGREWVHWMKRDRWAGLWWCVPGIIIIAAAVLPVDHAGRYWGLVPDQWEGILVATIMLGLAMVHGRRVGANDGRPEGLIREAKRMNGMTSQGVWFGVALVAQLALYFIWANHYRIAFEAFWAGLFVLTGSSCLLAAVATRIWTLLGWGIPLLGYGLCLPFVPAHGKVNGILFGLMFIAIALSFSLIAVAQVRAAERQNESH